MKYVDVSRQLMYLMYDTDKLLISWWHYQAILTWKLMPYYQIQEMAV